MVRFHHLMKLGRFMQVKIHKLKFTSLDSVCLFLYNYGNDTDGLWWG